MVTFLQEEACCQVFGMSIECKCDVTALCSDMASDALKTTGVAKEQNTAKGNVHRVQADQRQASQSDEADCEEGSRKQPEGPKGPEPPHHARRPMNAFLIFCKRHRGVVRDRFPHLENRSVTKILGEWWANLEAQEKASYTELAKQYKEAFLQANPDFKWYKLPAPPLRTLVTRPSNQTRPLKLECDTARGGPITPGKLADETQMGSLSSLLASLPPPPSAAPLTPPPLPPASGPPKPPKKRYLQELGAGELHHALPTPPVYRLSMAASEETDRSTESQSPFRQLRPSPTAPQKDGVLNEGTTLKTSKQDIIDRVVDRMCRLSDGEGIGSKVSDNNNDAQYPCSRERSLAGDVDSRCCTSAQSRKNLCHSSGSPGPPVEGNHYLEVTTEMDNENVSTVMPSGFEDFDKREKEPSAMLGDSQGRAELPITALEAGRKYADAIKDFFLTERDSTLSSFRSEFRRETANTVANCLNLRKTKASLKEFRKDSCETVGDTISSHSTLIREFGGSSRESSVSEDSDGSLEKTICEIKTKDSKDLSSSSDTSTESSSVSSQDLGAECRHQSTDNAGQQQSVVNSPGGSSASFECLPEERSLFTNKFTSRDCVEQLSCSPDMSNSSAGKNTGENTGPILAVTGVPEGDLVALSTPVDLSPPGAKISLKTGYLSPKVKKLRHSESTANIKNAIGPLKYVKCSSVPTFSNEEQDKEMTVSHGNYNRSKESAADFSVIKLEEHISEVTCVGQDVEGTVKEEGKKIGQKLVQVKPPVRTVESATQFDGSTCSEVVSEALKNKHSKLKNIYSMALLKYRRVLQDIEGKDGGKTEGLATAICHTDDSGIFSPVRYVECKAKSDINCGGEVKDKLANKISPANIQNKSPMKKLGKLRGPSKKREHFRLSSRSEIVQIEPEKHFKRRKLDTKIAEDLRTKNAQMSKSASEGFAEGVGVLQPFDILEGKDSVSGDRKLVTGGKTSGKCLDLEVYSNAQNGIYSSENFKNPIGTIDSTEGNEDNLSQKEKISCKVPFDCASSELCNGIENNEAVETCNSTVPSVQETARTFNELQGTARTEENQGVIDSVLKTDTELGDICASVGNIFNGGSGKTHDQSTLNTSSKLLRTSVPAQSFEDGSISVVEESAISELTTSSSPVVLDIDLDLTQTRLSPQGLADLAAKDGVVVLTLPVDDELVLPPLLLEPHPTVVAVEPTAMECLEVASQTLAEAESQDTTVDSIDGGGGLLAMDKDTSSIESEDSRESMSEEAAAPSTKVIDDISLEASELGRGISSMKCTEGPCLDSASSGAVAEILSPLTNVDKRLPVVDASADSSVSTQKNGESHEGDSSVARRKSTRTCKGLRYHQFMVEGRLKKGHRRPLSRGSSEKGVKTLRSSSCAIAVHSTGALTPAVPVTSPSDVMCALPSIAVPPLGSSNARGGSSRDVSSGSDPSDAEMDMPLELRNRFSTPDNMQRIYTTKSKFEKPIKDALEDSMLDSPTKKRFRAADFNLEEKIEALPSLSLEEFQMKKKARKRKPATPLPPLDSVQPLKQTVPSPAVSPDSTEGSNVAGNRVMLTVEATAVVASSDGSRLCSTTQLQSTGGLSSTSTTSGAMDVSRQLVGSQKRKARKQSITRLDSDNVHILRDTAVVEPAVLSNIALSSLATIAVTGSKLVK